MNFNLEKPLAFFDLETTGLHTVKDKIVQICIVKLHPDGQREELNEYVNPGRPIPQVVIDVHGIDDEKVKDCPKIEDLADQILSFFSGCDIAGYNSNYFDVPFLAEEMARLEKVFPEPGSRLIDMNTIFHKKEPRTLGAALQFYAQKELSGAHDAKNDVMATIDVFEGQRKKYEDIAAMNMEELQQFCQKQANVDLGGKLKRNANNEIVFAFGKNKDMRVLDHKGYAKWMIESDFPLQTKSILKKLLDESTPQT